MTKVVGVKFKKSPKVYYFEAMDFNYEKDMSVLVETARGLELGIINTLPFSLEEKDIVKPLKPVIRIATKEDLLIDKSLEEKRIEAIKISTDAINKSGLDMKLVDAEYTFDSTKLILYFTADNRVDFRELVKELASIFRVRIELRQIGTRDECKLKGGLGPCGRACCCNGYLSDFAHVTIKMAKNQNLSLNPTKISGLCGRLMCCLSYENNHYAEVNKRMPKMGSEVETDDSKKGTVISINQLKESVLLKINDKDIITTQEYPLSKLKFKSNKVEKESNQDEDDL